VGVGAHVFITFARSYVPGPGVLLLTCMPLFVPDLLHSTALGCDGFSELGRLYAPGPMVSLWCVYINVCVHVYVCVSLCV